MKRFEKPEKVPAWKVIGGDVIAVTGSDGRVHEMMVQRRAARNGTPARVALYVTSLELPSAIEVESELELEVVGHADNYDQTRFGAVPE